MAIPTSTTTYGKIIAPATRNDVSLKTSKTTGFSYPILLTPGKGYFSKSSGAALLKSMVSTLVRTERGERCMLPDYGVRLRRFLMEPLDEATFTAIKDDIETSFGKYLRKLKITKLQVRETRSSEINIKLFCSLRDSASLNFSVETKI